MGRPNYVRDIWILGPPSTGYPGAFPNGFVERVRRRWWGRRRLWVCSGTFKDPGGTTVDLNPNVRPDHVADAADLPLPSSSFDFVLLDPPYSSEEAERLYGLPYIQMAKALQEAWRVCEPEGHVLLLHRTIPINGAELPMRSAHVVGVVGVGIIGTWVNIRALTVWRRPTRLDVFAEAP